MDDLSNVWEDEGVRAAYWAIQHHPTPPEVLAAMKAQADFTKRRVEQGWPELSRDEKRLAARYDRVIADHHAEVLAAYRAAKAAPDNRSKT